MKICIDPGHGGLQPGACYGGIREADLTLPVCLDLAKHLRASGAEVLLTRTGDTQVSLRERCKLSNAFGADLFISLHFNAASSPDAEGAETWVWTGSRAYLRAKAIQERLVRATQCKDRGVRETLKFFVLHHTAAPAMVIEPGFMSNPAELLKLRNRTYQNAIIAGILAGIFR